MAVTTRHELVAPREQVQFEQREGWAIMPFQPDSTIQIFIIRTPVLIDLPPGGRTRLKMGYRARIPDDHVLEFSFDTASAAANLVCPAPTSYINPTGDVVFRIKNAGTEPVRLEVEAILGRIRVFGYQPNEDGEFIVAPPSNFIREE